MNTLSTQAKTSSLAASPSKRKRVKCVVWDLDNTLWQGTLLEGDDVRLRDNVAAIIRTLDSRGILQSIASRNHEESALAKLRELGLEEYFLYPQINWGAKSASVRAIAESLNIALNSFCLVDDQAFELAEVRAALPEVLCLDAELLPAILEMPELNPEVVTAESRMRRQMYLGDMRRHKVEEEFIGTSEDFLATLGMVFTIAPVRSEDLARAEELTNRTNQLNTTGRTFSQAELEELRHSPNHLLLMAELTDKFGGYGKIGLCVIECEPAVWTIRLLLMSCRVMNRGVGMVMLNHILRRAREAGVRLQSEFISNDRNRMMYVTYKFAGFKEIETRGQIQILEHDLRSIPPIAPYVSLTVE